MARVTFMAGSDFALALSRLGQYSDDIAKKAVYAGADVVTDAIRNKLDALPEDKFRYLHDGEVFSGVPESQKQDLQNSLGITPIDKDDKGDWNTKVGFDGYGGFKTKAYPNGVPNQLLARAVESGSSVRQATPFVRPAAKAAKSKAYAAMGNVVEDEIKKITK